MNNQLKRDLVNKVLKLDKMQQTEVFNIMKKENINYSSNYIISTTNGWRL